jgi:hypothetical protein
MSSLWGWQRTDKKFVCLAASAEEVQVPHRKGPQREGTRCSGDIYSLKSHLSAVLRIRIRRIHMFSVLPDPDPLLRDTDPDPDPSIIRQT